MTAGHLQRVTDRSAWIGDDLAKRTDEWIHRLSAAEIAELAARLRARTL